jgi:ACS family tartrate transporter-like MFS transporter
MGTGFVIAGYAHQPWVVVASLSLCFVACFAVQGPAFAVLTGFMAGRAAAAGIAAMNTISVLSGFAGPYWMGVMKDATGSYQAGLRGLLIPSLAAAGLMWALTRSLEKRTVAFVRLENESA